MHIVKKLDGFEIEKRVKYFSDNIMAETWAKYYDHIYHYFFDNTHQLESLIAFDIDNQDYLNTYNTFLSMKMLQLKINNNDGMADWFKEYTNDVISYLDKAFQQINENFNPYDSYDYFHDFAAGTEAFFVIAEDLEKIRLKYF